MIVKERYSVVVPVGGDGTLSTLLSLMVNDIQTRKTWVYKL